MEKNPERQIFRMNIDEGLASLDPAQANARAAVWTTAQVFNGLVELDSQLAVRPALARTWDLSPDGRVYTFFLRTDVYFHPHRAFGPDSSRRVTAQDFVYSFTRICDPATASSGRWIFSGKVAGLAAFDAGKEKTISGFRALNDSTFQVELVAPFPPFLGMLAMPYGFVVPQEVVSAEGDVFGRRPIGTGPFRFFRWTESTSLILHKNPAYFETENGQRLPFLDAIQVSFIPSRLSAFVEFLQGRLDFIGDLDAAYKDEILTPDGQIRSPYREQYTFLRAPQLNTEFLSFLISDTSAANPFADVRVRKAMGYAINRAQLTAYLLNGQGYPAESGMIPMGMPGFDAQATPGFTYDPDTAAQLLADAGYPAGKGLPEMVLHSTPPYAAISEYLQKSFEQIGLKVRIATMQGGALRTEAAAGRLYLWRASWIADYPDAENYLSLFTSANLAPKGPNRSRFANPLYDRYYAQAMNEPDDSLRFSIYRKMDQLMLASAPVIPLYYDRSLRILQKNVLGLGANPMNHLHLKRVRKTAR